jgi:beta-lactamase class D
MRLTAITLLSFCALSAAAQPDLVNPFRDCSVQGSTTIYDYQHKEWIFSDSVDAKKATLPASTFKIINLLIALETGVVKDENEVVEWVGKTDTTAYGYRPEIYKDMTVREAFEVSAVWVFIELAKKIGSGRYQHYLDLCHYGNADLSEKGLDFWNFGPLAISPVNQVEFLVRLYEGKLPFSMRNIAIVKKVMVTEQNDHYTIRSKTGWSRQDGRDTGWWVGYVEKKENVWFFATRISKERSRVNPGFGNCRKEITINILRQLKAIDN